MHSAGAATVQETATASSSVDSSNETGISVDIIT